MTGMDALPATGVPAEQVLSEISAMRAGDLPTHGGRLFAYVYDPAVPGLDDLAAAAHRLAAHVNGLVAAAAAVVGRGDATPVGSVTSGGTESLILAVKTARDARPEIANPRLTI